jgi:hypothetical protein
MRKLVLVAVMACSGGSTSLGQLDPRCETLCASNVGSCSTAVTDCQQECQLRVANMTPTCTTCLLDRANGGTCSQGAVCCPSPDFPNSALACESSCVGSVGVNPSGDHPICTEICASSDATCSSQAASCLELCDTRVRGVTGLCALCLLDGANGGTCASGQTCCPSPQFPTSATSCAPVCNN